MDVDGDKNPPLIIRNEPIGYLSFDPINQAFAKVDIDKKVNLDDIAKKYNVRFVDNSNTKHPEIGAPLSLTLYPSFKCSQKCKFCYFPHNLINKCDKMSSEVINAIIQYIYSKGIFSIDILGGEPFLPGTAQNTIKITKMALENGLHVYISSNGVHITSQHFKIIKKLSDKYGTFEISISLHGTKTIHNMLTQSNYFHKAIETLECLEKNGIPFGVNTVITSVNLYKLESFCSEVLTKFKNIQYWLILYPIECGAFHLWQSGIEGISVSKVLEQVDKLKSLFPNITTNIPFSYKYYKTKIPKNSYERLLVGCSAGRTKASIMPNGDIYFCCFFYGNDNFKLGNILDGKIFWEKEFDRNMFKLIPHDCHNFCEYYNFCDGCLAYTVASNKTEDRRCPHISNYISHKSSTNIPYKGVKSFL